MLKSKAAGTIDSIVMKKYEYNSEDSMIHVRDFRDRCITLASARLRDGLENPTMTAKEKETYKAMWRAMLLEYKTAEIDLMR